MKVLFFHLMPYADLDLDYDQKYDSAWVTLSNCLARAAFSFQFLPSKKTLLTASCTRIRITCLKSKCFPLTMQAKNLQ